MITSRLIDAVKGRTLSKVRERLAAGDRPDAIDEAATGESALAIAAANGDVDIVRALLDAGAGPNDGGTVSWPLEGAAGRGHADVVALLLEREADVDAQGEEGITALMAAAAGGHLDVVNLLLDAGANARSKDLQGRRAIAIAAEKQHAAVVAVLMTHATPADRKTATLLLKIASSESMQSAISRFHDAARDGEIEAVAQFLNAGGDVDALDSGGNTALFAAARGGQLEVIKLLVEHGANLNHLNLVGRCALIPAYSKRETAAYEYLRAAIAPKLVEQSDKWIKAAEATARKRYPGMFK